ncbi:unnamed protein product, partial [Laminaria digitata]
MHLPQPTSAGAAPARADTAAAASAAAATEMRIAGCEPIDAACGETMIIVMTTVMDEWRDRQITDELKTIKKFLNPLEVAADGQDGPVIEEADTYSDGAEAGGGGE